MVAAVAALSTVVAACIPAPPEPTVPPSGWEPFTAAEFPNVLSGLSADQMDSSFALVADDGDLIDPSAAMGLTPSTEQVTWLDDHHLIFEASGEVWVVDTLTGTKRATSIGGINLFPRAAANGRAVVTRWVTTDGVQPFPTTTSAGVRICVFDAALTSESCTYSPLAEALSTGPLPGYFVSVVAIADDATWVEVFAGSAGLLRYPVNPATGAVTGSPSVPAIPAGGSLRDRNSTHLLWASGSAPGTLNVQPNAGPATAVYSWTTISTSPRDAQLAAPGSQVNPAVLFTNLTCFDFGPDCPSLLRRWDSATGSLRDLAAVPWLVKYYSRYAGA